MAVCNRIFWILLHIALAFATVRVDDSNAFNDSALTTNRNENESARTEPDDDDQSIHYGQRCGDRNRCAEGLECQNLNLALGNRCMPDPGCLAGLLMEFERQHDLKEEFKARVFQNAGISQEDLITLFESSDSRKSFVESDMVAIFMQSIRTEMNQPAQDLWAIQRHCARFEYTNKAEAELFTLYSGFQIEGGAAIDGAFQYFQTVSGDSFYRGCLGPA